MTTCPRPFRGPNGEPYDAENLVTTIQSRFATVNYVARQIEAGDRSSETVRLLIGAVMNFSEDLTMAGDVAYDHEAQVRKRP